MKSFLGYAAVLISGLVAMGSNSAKAPDTLDADITTEFLSAEQSKYTPPEIHASGWSSEPQTVATSYEYVEDFSLVYFEFNNPTDPDWEDISNLEHLVDIEKFTAELVQSYGYSYQTHEPSSVPSSARYVY